MSSSQADDDLAFRTAEKRIAHAIRTNAIELSLANLGLREVPPTIAQARSLRRLELHLNYLTCIPDSLATLTTLEHLTLGNNRLVKLPDTMGNLVNLKSLYLFQNDLQALPETMRQLTRLTELNLDDNPGLGLPKEILAARPSAILGYYFRLHRGRRPINEAKLILVGRGGVGKSSLVKRLLFDTFVHGESRTEGISISEWNVRLRNQEDVRLHLWDFGGQEIMHATHQFFLTQRSLYLLVLEGRQGAEDVDAEYWLRLIASFGVDGDGDVSPVIVVLNKIKETPFDLNRRALKCKYPFIDTFVSTDCSDRSGLVELRTAILSATDRLKHLRDYFPSSWFEIKDHLASMKENFITFDNYRRLCLRHGELDAVAQESLAFYLHSLGIALNYKDDPRLRDTHVLNPHWVTTGIYKVLNSQSIATKLGELRIEDLSQILEPETYPRVMHQFLFNLMKKFELCFTFPDDDARCLIPELLDKQEPAETATFPVQECLRFDYRYAVLPEGLLPRFIVRTHALSENQPRWRTGVILAFERCRALVKSDAQDRTVTICVNGPVPDRRRLLAIIRSDMDHIHKSIQRLDPEEVVPVPGHPTFSVRYAKLLAFEARRKTTFEEELNGDVVEVDVKELLDGVDVARARTAPWNSRVTLFYSYSHKDEALRDELEAHIKILNRSGLIAEWNDRQIEAGEDWVQQIDDRLERANVILLLVSADFMASDYCYKTEMKRAMEKHERGEVVVIPIIVRDVSWKRAPFSRLKALPSDGKPVTSWPNRDAAWKSVCEGIEAAISSIRRST